MSLRSFFLALSAVFTSSTEQTSDAVTDSEHIKSFAKFSRQI